MKALLEWKYQVWVPALTATSLQVQHLPIFTLSAPLLTEWCLGNRCSFFLLLLAVLCLDPHFCRRNAAQQKFANGKPWLKKANKSTPRVVLTIGNQNIKSQLPKEKIWGKLPKNIYISNSQQLVSCVKIQMGQGERGELGMKSETRLKGHQEPF